MKAKKATKLLDRLDREVSYAQGLATVICGIEEGHGEETGAWELARVHIERLQEFSVDLATALRK
jgi:hypothetical protein